MQSVGFYSMAVLLVAGALGVIMARSALRSALCLIVTLSSLAVLFGLLDAPFVAAMQLLVYAGAIMVLFLFVIMLLNLGPDTPERPRYLAMSRVFGGLGVAYLTVHTVTAALVDPAVGRSLDGSVKHIGALLLSDALFAFEAISMLLLVAVVGAVVLGMRRLA